MRPSFSAQHRGGDGPPLVCVHGFTGTWRDWQLILPDLERRHVVLAPTLPGHAGGPPLPDGAPITDALMADAVERAMDAAGIGTAHLVGNSLGGYVALQLAARGRAESVVALAPAGGWTPGDPKAQAMFAYFATMTAGVRQAAVHADALLATRAGRRRATAAITTNFEHLSAELLAHQMVGAALCAAEPLLAYASEAEWTLDAAAIACPVRMVWGTGDQLLRWPSAARRYREEWLPHADWVELDGIGHCPQLDVPLETAHLILGHTSP